ncbi:MAG: MarP family serine protease [Microbacteriaceae bacterium]
MSGIVILDVILIVVQITYLGFGWTTGFLRGLGSLAGIIAGACVAVIAIGYISPLISVPVWRVVAALAVTVTLIGLGQTLGAFVGRLISAPVHRTPLKIIDRVLGSVATVLVASLILSLVAAGIAGLGMPAVSRAIGSSLVIRAIDSATPDPVKAVIAKARSAVFNTSFWVMHSALGLDAASTLLPDISTSTPELFRAGESVVRITGTAFSCGQYQSGSGFVAADSRVITNAHVVAGVEESVVLSRDGQSLPGRVVYFDPVADLAVIAVPGLRVAPLKLADSLVADDLAITAGFPWGGPFVSLGARVIDVSDLPIDDIYGESTAPRRVYTLAADVTEGDSGGPLLAPNGDVVGAIFARGEKDATVGYAVTAEVLAPVVAAASGFSSAVETGRCISSR